MPLHEKGNIYSITLVVSDPEDPTKSKIYYPKTYAEGILLDLLDPTKTMAFHLEDGNPEKVHLTEQIRNMLDNVSSANGILKTDEDGFIDRKHTPEKLVMLHYEFNTYQELLESTEFTEDDYGRIVVVNDITGFPKEGTPPGWAVVRLIGNPNRADGWQIIWTQDAIDRTADWSRFAPMFRSTVAEIDAMAALGHDHSNLEVLDSFSEDEEENLYYKGILIPDRNNFRTLIVTQSLEGVDLLPGDVGMAITNSREKTDTEVHPPVEEIKVLSGDCSGLYKDKTLMVHGPKINTDEVTHTNQMFMNDSAMLSIYHYNFNKVIEANETFKGCIKLVGVDGLGEASLVTAYSMYENSGIKYHPGMVAPYVKNLNSFFKNSAIKYFGDFKCPSLLTMVSFAENCQSLIETNPMSIQNCTNISSAFRGCTSLEKVGELKTRRVEDFQHLFQGDIRLKQVMSIDMTSARLTTDMFKSCPSLEYIHIVPGTLTVGISFRSTNISFNVIRRLVNGLPTITTHEIIDIKDTPAASEMNEDIVNLAVNKGWNLYY